MMKPEEAQKLLESHKTIKLWTESRLAGVERLDAELCAAGRMLLGRTPEGKPLGQNAYRMQSKAQMRMLRMSDRQLLALGEALLPQLTAAFRAGWDLVGQLPIMQGYYRRPFRSRDARLVHARRVVWLASLVRELEGYEKDITWLAAWASHLDPWGSSGHDLGLLLAGAINLNDAASPEVKRILMESAGGTHEVGAMGRHVPAALLCCEHPDAWDFTEKLLLAAQRQEGLRQAILETIDLAHAEAFRRCCRLILDQKLCRFSSVIRAADVWFGYQLDAVSQKYVEHSIEQMLNFMDSGGAREVALQGDDPDEVYVALWCTAFDEIRNAVAPARGLLKHKKAQVRAAAVHLLSQLRLPEAIASLLPALEDANSRIVASALQPIAADLSSRSRLPRFAAEVEAAVKAAEDERDVDPDEMSIAPVQADWFTALQKLLDRTPAKAKTKTLPAFELPWPTLSYTRGAVLGAMMNALGERSPTVMLQYLAEMDVSDRAAIARVLGREKQWDEQIRSAMLRLAGDSSPSVRQEVVQLLRKHKIAPADTGALLPLLSRKAEDLRRGVLSLLLTLEDAEVLRCADALLGSTAAPQRMAGLDLLCTMHAELRSAAACAERAQAYTQDRPDGTHDEEIYLEKILGGASQRWSLKDALGLMDPAQVPASPSVRKRNVLISTPASQKLITELSALVHEHRQEAFTFTDYSGAEQTALLGEARWQFPGPLDHHRGELRRRSVDELPLKDVWLGWWNNRSADVRDVDGLELVRASWALGRESSYQAEKFSKELDERIGLKRATDRYNTIVGRLVDWFLHLKPPANVPEFALDTFETVLAAARPEELKNEGKYDAWNTLGDLMWSPLRPLGGPSDADALPGLPNDLFGRFVGLLRYQGRPAPDNLRRRPSPALLAKALRLGLSNEHEIFDLLLGPRIVGRYTSYDFGELSQVSHRKPPSKFAGDPRLIDLVGRARQRVLDIELARGEQETVASLAALSLNYSGDASILVRLLQAMGRDATFKRNLYSWTRNTSKSCVFSHLVRVSWPAEADTPERVAAALKDAKLDQETLVAVAFFAPQWARHIEAVLGWEMFEDAVWWIHAHTKDAAWRVDREIREAWNAQIRQRTPLTLEELMEGAVDVSWFRRIHAKLGRKRWTSLDEFIKYASSGSGHTRARLFADAMLARVRRTSLVADIKKKRKQDAVRALGLLPLASGERARKDLLQRYKLMQEFIRTSRQFGSMRQASEKRAAAIGQQNLARTAGYPDPIRLQWAMEGLSCADLAKGPVVVTAGPVQISLAIGDDGLSEVSVTKDGKSLKAIPAATRKLEAVQELQERKIDLRRSASRMRLALEQAMSRGDAFTGAELRELLGNPILSPMLHRLVFVGESIMGYPQGDGHTLAGAGGESYKLSDAAKIRLAHPHDLLTAGNWSRWQHECFAAERVQPFKQVFRELYVLTDSERQEQTLSRRYAGQQVNPRQTMAILGQRQWVASPDDGVFRPFFDEGIVAWIGFMEGFYTPAEIEGLTIETVRFARRGSYVPMKLAEVPPRLFSEVMRDVDLIVSVAHRGQVDPEASASTVEMRATLLRETCQLLKLDNVTLKPPHVIVRGELGEYSLHLGSGNVHKMPGGMLFIVPVHSQHRGRLFLPFADDDPKTAEVISKALFLSRDLEIQDPAVLAQIRALT